MKFAWRIVSLLVGVVFVFAGVSKMVDFQPLRFLDPMAFARDIDNYKILPWAISVWLAVYLPWLEIICGLALIFRRFYSGALALLLGLMVVFIGASAAAKAPMPNHNSTKPDVKTSATIRIAPRRHHKIQK